MDTQPLLRATHVKPQNNPSATARESNSNPFGQHLQDQMRQPDTAATSRRDASKGPKQAEAPATPVASEQQQAIESEQSHAAEQTAAHDIAVLPDGVDVSLEGDDLLAQLPVIDTGLAAQNLPEDGNVLPLLVADLLVDESSQNLKQVPLITTDVLPKNVEASLAASTATMVPAKAADILALTENKNSIPELALVPEEIVSTRDMPLPEMKMQIKSDEMMSDRQFAALIAEANKSSSASLQQVQAASGSATANLHSYMPPQFSPAHSASPTIHGSSINTPLNHPAWGNQVGDQLVFMLQGKLQLAEIKLNPAHLGPMEIRLSIQDDKASVTFISAHAPVREALDAALPRLREMMEQQGLNLANVDVSAHSGGQQQAFEESGAQSNAPALNEPQVETVSSDTVIATKITSGLSVFV